jgi:antirestriction protein ArdC
MRQEYLDKLKQILEDSHQGKIKQSIIDHYRINAELHHYSFLNSLMIAAQGGTCVASFKTWKKNGRFVKRGEKAKIEILVPFIKKTITEDLNGEQVENESLKGFFIGKVFDVSQTDGKPLEYKNNSRECLTIQYDKIKEYITKNEGVTINESFTGEARGYISGKTITISNISNNIDKVKTLLHELSHFYHGHTEAASDDPRSLKEVQAESSTYLAMISNGIDCECSIDYIKGWNDHKNDVDIVNIIKVAEKLNKIINN